MNDLTPAEEIGIKPTSLMLPPKGSGPDWEREEMRKTNQIIDMTRQLFDIQDTYGKTAKQLDNLLVAMVEDLREFQTQEIEAAFVEWRRTSHKIPAPFNIRDLILKAKKDKAKASHSKRWCDFDGSWAEYQEYLKEKGLVE